ncbi:MAG: DMT family transporter [Rhodanobacteraceae bacterium]
MPHSASTRTAWIGLLVLTVIWAFGWTTMKIATRYSGPFTFSADRYIVGSVVLFALLALRRSDLRPTPWLPTILIGLTQTAGFQALEQWALMSGGVGKSVLLAYTMPFWVVPLAWWWVHEKPGPRRWVCIGVAAVGFVCVVEPWRPLGTPWSILLALAGGFVWAIGTVLAKRVFIRHPDVSPLRLTAWQMLVGTVALVIVMLGVHERPVDWTGLYVGALLYNGVLSSALGWVLWAVVIQRLSASVAGLSSLMVPVLGVLFAWAVLREAPSGMEWVGIALIGGALLALNLWTRYNRPAPVSDP